MSKLNLLPSESLLQICMYIDGTYRPSLKSLAVVSKNLHSAAVMFLFHTVKVHVLGANANVPQLVLANIRHLVVYGRVDEPQGGTTAVSKELFPSALKDSEIHLLFSRSNESSFPEWAKIDTEARTSPSSAGESIWMPLRQLIEAGPFKLSDLTWASSSTMHRSLLTALNHVHSNCKLHVRTFYFRTKDQTVPDEDEIALWTSPCLYSISTSYAPLHTDETSDFNAEAIRDMLAASSLGINLKELVIIPHPMGATPRLRDALRTRPKWPGFQSRDLSDQIQGSGFSAIQYLHISAADLIEFSRVAEFSILQHLDLVGSSTAIHTNEMNYSIANCNFTSLKTLAMRLESSMLPPRAKAQYNKTASIFLDSLLPLEALSVGPDLSPALIDTIITSDGKALKSLQLYQTLNIEKVIFDSVKLQALASSCPQLEELTIEIPRTGGDAAEIAIYKTFGLNMPRLQRLSLTLDASNLALGWCYDYVDDDGNFIDEEDYAPEAPPESRFDNFDNEFFPYPLDYDRKIRNGHIREAFIRSGLDEPLACSIFSAISDARSCSGPRSLRLEFLQLKVKGGLEFGSGICRKMICGTESDVVDWISRSWLVTRPVRDDDLGLTARELERHLKESNYRSERYDKLDGPVEAIFRKIWPAKEEGSDWRNDWYGAPLNLSSL